MSTAMRIARFFRSTPKAVPDVGRTLFIELSEMGSAILADSAMRKLREKSGSELYFVIFQQNAESLELLRTIPTANIFCLRTHNFRVLAIDVFRFMRWCWKKKITTVIDLELYSRFTALVSVLSGSKFRVGFDAHFDEGFYRGHLINYPVRYNAHVHISVNFMSLVNKAMGLYPTPYPTTYVQQEDLCPAKAEISQTESEEVAKILNDLLPAWKEYTIVLFNINASDMLPQRRWLPENFVKTAAILLAGKEDICVIATGMECEKDYVQTFVNQVDSPRCVNAAGLFTLRQLVGLYYLSKCMLTNDSGPAHFASVTPLKTFVLFGPETPALYMPLGNTEVFYAGLACSPCVSAANHRKTNCDNPLCMHCITVEEVSERVLWGTV